MMGSINNTLGWCPVALPTVQLSADALPMVAVDQPSGHCVQFSCPVVFENVPTGHRGHWSSFEKVPGLHITGYTGGVSGRM